MFELQNQNHKITHTGFVTIDSNDVIDAIQKISHKKYHIATWNCKDFVKYLLKELSVKQTKQKFENVRTIIECVRSSESAVNGENEMHSDIMAYYDIQLMFKNYELNKKMLDMFDKDWHGLKLLAEM